MKITAFCIPGAQKRTIERYEIKFHTLVAHSIIRKYIKLHSIIYGNDKIMLLLVMAT